MRAWQLLAATSPWGMNAWSPQTAKMGDGWFMPMPIKKIRGLRKTHHPSPWINDYGAFALFAMTGQLEFDEDKRASWFSHKAGTASLHYYSVYLADYDVTAEITPTDRAAVFRFTFPETNQAYVLLDAFFKGSSVEIDVWLQSVHYRLCQEQQRRGARKFPQLFRARIRHPV